MSVESTYEFLILLLMATIVLELIARRLRLPPAAALIVGGVVLALTPGVPTIHIDPEMVMLIFLPPLLMSGAYFTVWHEFKKHFGEIASLALRFLEIIEIHIPIVARSHESATPQAFHVHVTRTLLAILAALV